MRFWSWFYGLFHHPRAVVVVQSPVKPPVAEQPPPIQPPVVSGPPPVVPKPIFPPPFGPHAPDVRLITDMRFHDAIPKSRVNDVGESMGNGWQVIYNALGRLTNTIDALLGDCALFSWLPGDGDGTGPATALVGFPPVTHVYAAVQFQHNAEWQGQTGGTNKLFYLEAGAGSIYVAMYPDGPDADHPNRTNAEGPFRLRVYAQFNGVGGGHYGDPTTLRGLPPVPPNHYGEDWWLDKGYLMPNARQFPLPDLKLPDGRIVRQAVMGDPVLLGEWNIVELEIDGSTLHLWLNDVLQCCYVGLPVPPEGFTESHLDPVWGGTDKDTKKRLDTFRVARVEIRGQ